MRKLASGAGDFGLARKNLLGRAHGGSECDRLAGDMRHNVLESGQGANGVEIIVVTDVRHAEKLALHFALAIRHHGVEGFPELLDDRSGVNASGDSMAVTAEAGDEAENNFSPSA